MSSYFTQRFWTQNLFKPTHEELSHMLADFVQDLQTYNSSHLLHGWSFRQSSTFGCYKEICLKWSFDIILSFILSQLQ